MGSRQLTMGELEAAVEKHSESGDTDPDEISIHEKEEDAVGCYRCDPDDEETMYSDKFGTMPTADPGCFGSIILYFVNKKQKKVRKNHKSLISRNQRVKKGFNRSIKKLKDRTTSMMSVASTNFKNSRTHLAESMTNLSIRSRHPSASRTESLPARMRHMSMQDRLETYNEELASEEQNAKERKVSTISFDVPTIVPPPVITTEPTTSEKPASVNRARKVSKISAFEFVPEEKEKPVEVKRESLDVPI